MNYMRRKKYSNLSIAAFILSIVNFVLLSWVLTVIMN